MIAPPVVRIPAPAPVTEPARAGFPWIAALAPLALAGVLFAVTGSPFMLLMAVLSPVIAVATALDARRQRRRTRREEAARFARELAAAGERVRAAQEAERARLAGFAALDPAWSRAPGDPLELAVGRGDVPSGVELGGMEGRAEDAELERLRADAGVLARAPLAMDLARGAAISGPAPLAAAVARTLVLRLAARLSPALSALQAPPGEAWTRALPHAVAEGAPGVYRFDDGESVVAVAWAAVPPEGAVRIDARAGDATTAVEAKARATRLAAAAEALRVRALGAALPGLVRLGDLLDADPARDGLSAPIGRDADGAVSLDLVADGPHAIVAGTTGSGKSELLVSWVLGMADGRGPDEVAFVLVDFKGGAAFAPLAGLPHVLGTLSDLDERLARRAIESLRAEVLRRERLLAEAGARGIAELPPRALARLVVVVDEFAALVAERPELHALFADLSARGRSLGIHLVLCTQRPAGVVRDAVLANVAVRIALRVADRADSLGLLGDDAAARLPADARGRAVLADGRGEPRLVQLALADAADVARVSAVPDRGATPRPWCDPLPARIPHAALPAGEGIRFGLLDLPAEQRQPVAAWLPRHGHALVLGAPGSGVSTALDALAAGAGDAARRLPRDLPALWDVLADPPLEPGTVLLADDLDLVLARADPGVAPDLVDLLARLLREAPHHGVRVAVGARRLGGPLLTLAPAFGARLLLRAPSREELVLAGGDGSRFDPAAPPGSGLWDGVVVQVAIPDAVPRRAVEVPPPAEIRPPRGELAVVSGRPREVAAWAESAGVRVQPVGVPRDGAPVVAGGGVVFLGDPDSWQADWTALARARRDLPVVFHAATAADVRAVLRARETPPPLRDGEVWLAADGRIRRARLGDPGDAGGARLRPAPPRAPSR